MRNMITMKWKKNLGVSLNMKIIVNTSTVHNN